MEQISFIINPISGHGRKKTIERNIEKYLNQNFNLEILYTKAAKHAIELSRKASDKSDIIVAVGGDGSIHEVGQPLVGLKNKMGIIPMGSGNGLARHLQIPINVKDAITVINNNKSKPIDVLDFGTSYGLNVSGLGFDAHIAQKFADYGKRGFASYLKITINEFLKYKSQKYSVEVDGEEAFETEAFLISFANSSQFGNNAYIAPEAIIDDGLFELVMLSPFRKRASANIGLKLFTKKIDQSKYLNIIKAKSVKIRSTAEFSVHMDGETMGQKKELDVKIRPSSLNIIVP